MKCRINETTERHSEGEDGHTQIRIINGKMNMKNKRIITDIDNTENYIVRESVVSKRKEKICSDKKNKKTSGYTRSHSESRTNKRKKKKNR